MFRPVEAEGEGPELTFYQLTVIEERKKGAEKYKTYQIPQKLLVALLLFT